MFDKLLLFLFYYNEELTNFSLLVDLKDYLLFLIYSYLLVDLKEQKFKIFI
jgi:hypothetical protein